MACSAGSGSTWWRQSQHHTIRRTPAAAALPSVIGGPGWVFPHSALFCGEYRLWARIARLYSCQSAVVEIKIAASVDPLFGDANGRDGAVDMIRRPPTCAVFNRFGRHTDTSARLFLPGRLDCYDLLFPGRRRFPIRRFSPKIGRIGGAALGLRAIGEPPPGFRRILSEQVDLLRR